MEIAASRPKILRISTVAEMLGVSKVTLWRWERKGVLPAKRKLGPNTVGWVEDEILRWLESRPKISPGVDEDNRVSGEGGGGAESRACVD